MSSTGGWCGHHRFIKRAPIDIYIYTNNLKTRKNKNEQRKWFLVSQNNVNGNTYYMRIVRGGVDQFLFRCISLRRFFIVAAVVMDIDRVLVTILRTDNYFLQQIVGWATHVWLVKSTVCFRCFFYFCFIVCFCVVLFFMCVCVLLCSLFIYLNATALLWQNLHNWNTESEN